jgi:hypothetical protein
MVMESLFLVRAAESSGCSRPPAGAPAGGGGQARGSSPHPHSHPAGPTGGQALRHTWPQAPRRRAGWPRRGAPPPWHWAPAPPPVGPFAGLNWHCIGSTRKYCSRAAVAVQCSAVQCSAVHHGRRSPASAGTAPSLCRLSKHGDHEPERSPLRPPAARARRQCCGT